MDLKTLPYAPLSAQVKGSYAYKTVKDRLPVILTKVIDYLCREKHNIVNSDGQLCSDELKTIIGKLSQLRSEMLTNKPLWPLVSAGSPDFQKWNSCHSAWLETAELKWFESPWLYVECHLYRVVEDIFEQSTHLKEFDWFTSQKRDSFLMSQEAMEKVATFTSHCLLPQESTATLKHNFIQLLEISLWGNRNDLSFFAGSPVEDTIKSTNGCLDNLEHLKSNIIVNHSEDVWNYIDQSPKNGENRILTIILDNGALELISDLCLATFCSTHNIFSHVRFYVKRIPWFVSDVTAKDFRWTLEHLNGSDSSPVLQQLSAKWLHFLDTRQWEVVEEEFWTLPLPYSAMKKEDKALYEKLSHSQLIIFKGDLNYRKLGADLHWPTTTSFNEFLQGFNPAPLVTLRTIKAEIVCGLASGQEEDLLKTAEDWMYSGDYAVIQFANCFD